MHYLTLLEDLVLNPAYTIKKGKVLADDLNVGQLVSIAGAGLMEPFVNNKQFDDSKDWNGKKILLIRAGGFGDLVLMTPIFREIKRRWPTCIVHVSTMPSYAVVLQNLISVDACVNYPVDAASVDQYDAIISFENAIERNPSANKIHMTDLFAEIVGLKKALGLAALGGHPTVEDKRAEYVITQNEMIWLIEQHPRVAGKRRLCIQGGASARCRIYPGHKFDKVVNELLKKDWEIFLLGGKGEVKLGKGVTNLHNLTDPGATFRQSCAVINSSDCFLGNDSALLHVAGALGIPAVGLYGSFRADLRTEYAETTFAFQGDGSVDPDDAKEQQVRVSCEACFHHTIPARRDDFPPHCPSSATGYCGLLASIRTKRIIAKIEQIAKKFDLVAV